MEVKAAWRIGATPLDGSSEPILPSGPSNSNKLIRKYSFNFSKKTGIKALTIDRIILMTQTLRYIPLKGCTKNNQQLSINGPLFNLAK